MFAILINVVFIGWVVLLVYKGISSRENWLGWFMFSRARFFTTDLRDRHGEVDVWEYLPHCQVMLSQRQIEALLRHIQSKRGGGYLSGTVTMYLNDGIAAYSVRRNLLTLKSLERS